MRVLFSKATALWLLLSAFFARKNERKRTKEVTAVEILITVIAIMALLLILGVSLEVIALIIVSLLMLAVSLMGIFFCACLILFARARREDAQFTGMDDSRGYKVAVYKLSDSELLHNIFPAEISFVEYVYNETDVRVSVCRLGKRKFVIDGHSLFIIVLGFFLSLLSTAGITIEIISLFARG